MGVNNQLIVAPPIIAPIVNIIIGEVALISSSFICDILALDIGKKRARVRRRHE